MNTTVTTTANYTDIADHFGRDYTTRMTGYSQFFVIALRSIQIKITTLAAKKQYTMQPLLTKAITDISGTVIAQTNLVNGL